MLKLNELLCVIYISIYKYINLFVELTTPTFNLTATPKNRRKANIDISDPIYKLPFEYGK